MLKIIVVLGPDRVIVNKEHYATLSDDFKIWYAEMTRKLPIVSTTENFEEVLKRPAEEEVLICGGAELYEMALPHAEYIYIANVKQAPPNGHRSVFPEIDATQKGPWHTALRDSGDCVAQGYKLEAYILNRGRFLSQK